MIVLRAIREWLRPLTPESFETTWASARDDAVRTCPWKSVAGGLRSGS